MGGPPHLPSWRGGGQPGPPGTHKNRPARSVKNAQNYLLLFCVLRVLITIKFFVTIFAYCQNFLFWDVFLDPARSFFGQTIGPQRPGLSPGHGRGSDPPPTHQDGGRSPPPTTLRVSELPVPPCGAGPLGGVVVEGRLAAVPGWGFLTPGGGGSCRPS